MTQDKHGIPTMGLGTSGLTGDTGLAAMQAALEVGFRHLDTAQSYETEENVGRAVVQSARPRDAVFITTKITRRNLSRERLIPSLRESLARLQVAQADLVLIHWPMPEADVALQDYLEPLAEAQASGLARMIGVSNFTRRLLDQAVAIVGEGALVTNQVEVHPFLQNRKLRQHCAELGITVTAYMPLAVGKVAADPTLQRIAHDHGATPAQVSLAWLLREGMIVIPRSSSRAHMQSNLAAYELTLTDGDAEQIAALDRGDRIVNPANAPAWD
jgi:2,5-diketo-D-gluconate reductase B